MDKRTSLLVFEVDEHCCALPLDNVLKVESAVQIFPLAGAPEVIAGVVNVHGELLPVMNMHKRLKCADREMALSDHLIIATTSKRNVALWVEDVIGVDVCETDLDADFDQALESLPHLSGVTLLNGRLILIHDLEQFLTAVEDEQLTQAMSTTQPESYEL